MLDFTLMFHAVLVRSAKATSDNIRLTKKVLVFIVFLDWTLDIYEVEGKLKVQSRLRSR